MKLLDFGKLHERKGILRISDNIITSEPDVICDMFSKLQFLPLRAEHLAVDCVMQYQGISPKLPIVPHGTLTPKYEIEVDRVGYTYRFLDIHGNPVPEKKEK